MSKFELLAFPGQGNSSFLSLYRLNLPESGKQEIETGDNEHVLDVLSGQCQISGISRETDEFEFRPLGERLTIFDGTPAMAYIPRHSRYQITSSSGTVRAMVYIAPTDEDSVASQASGESVKVVDAGISDWSRRVYIGFGEDSPTTRMMVG